MLDMKKLYWTLFIIIAIGAVLAWLNLPTEEPLPEPLDPAINQQQAISIAMGDGATRQFINDSTYAQSSAQLACHAACQVSPGCSPDFSTCNQDSYDWLVTVAIYDSASHTLVNSRNFAIDDQTGAIIITDGPAGWTE